MEREKFKMFFYILWSFIVDFDSSNSENVFYKASTTRVETVWSKSNVTTTAWMFRTLTHL